MTRTYLLGAGFSKALRPSMPLMGDLARKIPARLGLPGAVLEPFAGDVERWLSFLAEPQPWLNQSQNLTNQSLFLRASEAVGEEIRAASRRDEPDNQLQQLLDRFVLDAKLRRSPILTFNYDLLIEDVFTRWKTKDRSSYLYPLPLVERYAAGQGRWLSLDPPIQPPAQLLKLHGSLNWRCSLEGLEGPATWTREGLKTETDSDSAGDPLYQDLHTLVVPPASSKSRFYGGAAMRVLWRHAAHLLNITDELIIIGYSLPKTDLQVATLLATSLQPGTAVSIVDVTNATAARARELLPTQKVAARISRGGVRDFVMEECGPIAVYGEAAPPHPPEQWVITGDDNMGCRTGQNCPGAAPDTVPLRDKLARVWPSILATHSDAPPDEKGRPQWRAYVPLDEWRAAPNPLASAKVAGATQGE